MKPHLTMRPGFKELSSCLATTRRRLRAGCSASVLFGEQRPSVRTPVCRSRHPFVFTAWFTDSVSPHRHACSTFCTSRFSRYGRSLADRLRQPFILRSAPVCSRSRAGYLGQYRGRSFVPSRRRTRRFAESSLDLWYVSAFRRSRFSTHIDFCSRRHVRSCCATRMARWYGRCRLVGRHVQARFQRLELVRGRFGRSCERRDNGSDPRRSNNLVSETQIASPFSRRLPPSHGISCEPLNRSRSSIRIKFR